MRCFLAASLLLAAMRLGAAPANPAIFPYRHASETLSNGLKIVVIPMESPGLVAYYTIVRTGSRDEVEPGKSGFAHFFEHMMFRGTPKYSAAAYEGVLTRLGASHNAYTTDDLTAYHLTFASDDLEQVMELESDRFQNLAYTREVFQTEAGAVYGEYRKNITSPFRLLAEKLQDRAYDVHTYKHTTMGFEHDIQAMPEQYEYSRSFFRRFYRPENCVLVIAGDVKPPAVFGLAKKYYGAWQRGYEAPKIQPEPEQRGERTTTVDYPGRTLPILTLAYKGDAFEPRNREFMAALLLADLAFGETSALRKKLLLQEQKVQTLGAHFPLNRDQPLFEITAMVKRPDDVATVRDEIYRTLEQFKHTPVEPPQLRDLKRRNKYSFLLSLDSPDAVAGGLARFVALTGDIAVVETFYAQLDTITAEEIMRAAKKYFTPERRTVAVLKGNS